MIRIVVADDHPVVREGLKRIIDACPDMQVVGEAGDGFETMRVCRALSPGVVLLDVTMPGPGFIDVLRRLRSDAPATRVLVMSIHDPSLYALRAVRAGAAGYLTKDRSPRHLAEALRRVDSGRRYLTEDVAEALACAVEQRSPERPHELLSDRQYQVFLMLGSAKSVSEIARELHLSPKTVSTHRAHILEKMNMRTNAELIRYAVQNGFVA